jgi:hypothetical protein
MTAGATELIIPAVFFVATTIRSTFGFGEALIAVPILALLLPVKVATPVAVLASITVALIVVLQDWRHVHARSAVRLVLSTLLGIPLGLLLLKRVPEPYVKFSLGVVILAFSLYWLLGRKRQALRLDLRLRCRRARRRLRHERAAAGHLRVAAGLVAAAIPCDAAGIFPSGERSGDERVLGGWIVDVHGQPFLSAFSAVYYRCRIFGPRHQSPVAQRPLRLLRSRRTNCDRRGFAPPGAIAPSVDRPPARGVPRSEAPSAEDDIPPQFTHRCSHKYLRFSFASPQSQFC